LSEALDYFDENYIFDEKFENVDVVDYEIKELSDTIEEILENDEKIVLNKRIIVPKEKIKKISVDMGMSKLIELLNKNKIITVYSCRGHLKDESAYVSLYCLESDFSKIRYYITEFFKGAVILIEDDNECWQQLSDGRKFYTFRW
jgi:hypothetical protein